MVRVVVKQNNVERAIRQLKKKLMKEGILRELRLKWQKQKEIRMARPRLSKKQKVLNLLSKGQPVFWKTLRSRFDLVSPRAMIDTLRSEGHMIYINQNTGTNGNNTSYRIGTPTKAIIAAGIQKLYGTKYAY